MGLKFHAKQLELKRGRKPVTHLRILSRKVNLIQFVLPKDHYSSLVGGGLKEENLMTRQAASYPGRLGEQGGVRQGVEEGLNPNTESDTEWMGPRG